MGERQRVMIARALSTEPQPAARRRADGQPRHPARPRSARAAARAVPRARRRGRARQPRPAGGRVRRPCARAARRAASASTRPSRRLRAVKLSNASAPVPRAPARAAGWRSASRSLGIAAGVALLFASQVSSSQPAELGGQLSRGIAGDATLQLLARDPQGFPQSMLARVRASPVCASRRRCWKRARTRPARKGSESVELIGADPSLSELGGTLVRHAELRTVRRASARSCCPPRCAHAIGVTQVRPGSRRFQIAGHTADARRCTSSCHANQIGRVDRQRRSRSRRSSYAQELTGLAGVASAASSSQPAPGARSRACGRRCRRLAAGRLERRADRLRRDAVREGRGGEQPVNRAVRGDQRARGVPVRVQRDAADRARNAGG